MFFLNFCMVISWIGAFTLAYFVFLAYEFPYLLRITEPNYEKSRMSLIIGSSVRGVI